MAPIIDPSIPAWRYKFYCKWWGNQKYLGLTSRFHDLWLSKDWFKLWLVRSEEERHYTNYCLERSQKIIKKVPLHFLHHLLKFQANSFLILREDNLLISN